MRQLARRLFFIWNSSRLHIWKRPPLSLKCPPLCSLSPTPFPRTCPVLQCQWKWRRFEGNGVMTGYRDESQWGPALSASVEPRLPRSAQLCLRTESKSSCLNWWPECVCVCLMFVWHVSATCYPNMTPMCMHSCLRENVRVWLLSRLKV